MAEQGPAEARLPSERASPIPGGSPRSDGSAFSAEGDRTIIDIQLANADTQRQGAPVAAPPGFPPPPPTALPSGMPFSTDDNGDEVTQAAFHRAIAHQKDITDLLFDPACKLTNQQRSKIIAHLRNILQECADIRAVAARQSGRVDELRHQLTRFSAAPSYRPTLMPPADAGPAPSYASVLAGGQQHPGQQMASRGPECPAAPPQQAQPSGFDAQPLPHIRQEHAHLMFLTPLVPSTSPANDLIKLIKTNIDPTKEKIGPLVLRQTKYGLTVLTNHEATLKNFKTAIEKNTLTSTSISIRVPQKRRPRVKFTGVDPDVASTTLVQCINQRNDGINLNPDACRVVASYRERSGNFTHVLEVDSSAYRALTARGRIMIGWTTVHVSEDLHIPVCTYCASYGHTRRSCPVSGQPDKLTCTRCSANHAGEQCAVRAGDPQAACNECKKQARQSTHPVGHSSCPILQERVARLRARTDYG